MNYQTYYLFTNSGNNYAMGASMLIISVFVIFACACIYSAYLWDLKPVRFLVHYACRAMHYVGLVLRYAPAAVLYTSFALIVLIAGAVFVVLVLVFCTVLLAVLTVALPRMFIKGTVKAYKAFV